MLGVVFTLAAPCSFETEEKKSRFLARACRADSREEAMAFLESVKDPKATHNCWALRIGQDYRFSDDGEPGGTAGQPILRAIDSQGLDHVMAVVVRHFGGIKLGAGGLSRAYGGTAAECLRLAQRLEVRPTVVLKVALPFDAAKSIWTLLERYQAHRRNEHYTETGLELELEIESALAEAFRSSVRDATRGKARFEE